MKDFTVKFSLSDDEFLTALRLVAGAVCNVHQTPIDALEDFKVCVTESVLIFKNSGYGEVEVRFFFNDGVCCTVSGMGGVPAEGDCELSLALVSALVDSCDIERSGEIIKRVTLKL